jgi:hypothetical protein
MVSYEDYVEYLKQTLSKVERLTDSFSGSDERLDYVVKQLLVIQPQIEELSSLLNELKEAGYVMPLQTQQISIRQVVPPNQGIRVQEMIPLDGRISSITVHFPLGAAGLMQIAVGHGAKQICPISGFLQLDNATPVFPASEACKRQDILWVVMQNTDALWPHIASVAVMFEGN